MSVSLNQVICYGILSYFHGMGVSDTIKKCFILERLIKDIAVMVLRLVLNLLTRN